jgi:hypothetical protein
VVQVGSQVGSIVGKGGASIRGIQQTSGARCHADFKTNEITVSGTEEQVAMAVQLIQAKIQEGQKKIYPGRFSSKIQERDKHEWEQIIVEQQAQELREALSKVGNGEQPLRDQALAKNGTSIFSETTSPTVDSDDETGADTFDTSVDSTVVATQHLKERMAERNFTKEDVQRVREHGQVKVTVDNKGRNCRVYTLGSAKLVTDSTGTVGITVLGNFNRSTAVPGQRWEWMWRCEQAIAGNAQELLAFAGTRNAVITRLEELREVSITHRFESHGVNVKVVSAEDSAHVLVNGTDYSLNGMGLNVVVLSAGGQFESAATFNPGCDYRDAFHLRILLDSIQDGQLVLCAQRAGAGPDGQDTMDVTFFNPVTGTRSLSAARALRQFGVAYGTPDQHRTLQPLLDFAHFKHGRGKDDWDDYGWLRDDDRPAAFLMMKAARGEGAKCMHALVSAGLERGCPELQVDQDAAAAIGGISSPSPFERAAATVRELLSVKLTYVTACGRQVAVHFTQEEGDVDPLRVVWQSSESGPGTIFADAAAGEGYSFTPLSDGVLAGLRSAAKQPLHDFSNRDDSRCRLYPYLVVRRGVDGRVIGVSVKEARSAIESFSNKAMWAPFRDHVHDSVELIATTADVPVTARGHVFLACQASHIRTQARRYMWSGPQEGDMERACERVETGLADLGFEEPEPDVALDLAEEQIEAEALLEEAELQVQMRMLGLGLAGTRADGGDGSRGYRGRTAGGAVHVPRARGRGRGHQGAQFAIERAI